MERIRVVDSKADRWRWTWASNQQHESRWDTCEELETVVLAIIERNKVEGEKEIGSRRKCRMSAHFPSLFWSGGVSSICNWDRQTLLNRPAPDRSRVLTLSILFEAGSDRVTQHLTAQWSINMGLQVNELWIRKRPFSNARHHLSDQLRITGNACQLSEVSVCKVRRM